MSGGPQPRLATRGIVACGGVAVGPATLCEQGGRSVPRHRLRCAADDEIDRLRVAIEASRAEIEGIRSSLAPELQSDYGLILDAHMLMHRDELLVDATARLIREELVNAEWAVERTVESIRSRLAQVGSGYFRERAADVEHVGRHILRHLMGETVDLTIHGPTVLVSHDLSPAEAARLLQSEVRGLVTALGTATSHTALLARTLDIPAVVGAAGILKLVEDDDVIIVDGLRGEVIVRPADDERERAEERGARYRLFTGRLRAGAEAATTTADQERIELMANLELPAEAALASLHGADGVGLYRTEFLFLDRTGFPGEEEQLRVYGDVARVMAPRPVVFRTFDLGGDKLPHGTARGSTPPPPNPALGLRAIRFSLARPEMLKQQVRAVLRAAVHGDVSLMFPMIGGVAELREARAVVDGCVAELSEQGIAHAPIKLGIMIEVPSAVLVADVLARECDFFSVGTNDLVQYTLALDRSNPDVAHLASVLDPAVLRLLELTATAAEKHGLPLAMCGDMAADPVALPVVIGLGYRRISVPVAFLGLVREMIRRIHSTEARAVAREALTLDCAAAVRELVVRRFRDALGEIWTEQGLDLP